MPKNTDPEEPVDPTPGDDTQVTDGDNQQSDNSGSQDDSTTIDWEKRYRSLQSVSEKKRTDLEKTVGNLQEQLTTATEKMESMGIDQTSFQKAQEEAKRDAERIQEQLDAATKERDQLNAQLKRQSIILKEFPTLASFTEFIPPAEDDDQFKANLTDFQQALNSYVESGVKTVMAGASGGDVGAGDDPMITQSDEDKAWADVYALAGVGKEKEYEEAYARLQGILEAKKS